MCVKRNWTIYLDEYANIFSCIISAKSSVFLIFLKNFVIQSIDQIYEKCPSDNISMNVGHI